jgi:RHS repeat-associated protein
MPVFGRRRRARRGAAAVIMRRTRTKRSRLAGAGALVALLSMIAAAFAAPSAAAAPAHRILPRVQRQVPVPVHPYKTGHRRPPVMRQAARPVIRWPAANTATVRLRSSAATTEAALRAGSVAAARGPRGNAALSAPSKGAVRAGSLPIEVGPADTASSARHARDPGAAGAAALMPSRVRVSVASHAAAEKAGISGVIFTLGRADGGRAASRVHVSLDYASFAGADWGGYADRLRLVELPGCALTTPHVPACRRQTPVASDNDVVASRLGADVALPGSGPAAPGQGSEAASAAGVGAGPDVVMGITTGTSGSGGNYAATPLSQSANWSEGGDSGAFTYSYNLAVPSVPGGLQPNVTFGYNSQAVDGLTSSTNDQASEIGDGWSYDPGYIERDYQTCANNKSLPTSPTNEQTGDLCWNSSTDVTTMMLNGSSTTLVDDPTNGWTAEADNGAKITYETGSGSNGTNDDDYWVVTETDGTSYYFGLNELPGYTSTDTATDSADTVPVYGPVSGDPCYHITANTFAGSVCNQAWRWNLDYVTDSHGDAMAYFYNTETNYYAQDEGTTAPKASAYTQASTLTTIEYGLRAGAVYGTTPAAEVNFTAPESRTDIPTSTANGATDLACASGAACTVTSPTFWTKYDLTTVATKALDGSTLEPVDSWALQQDYPQTDDTTPPSLWLESITRTGEDGSPTVPLPAVSFAGHTYGNRVNVTDGYDPLTRYRITQITTETGQDITVQYAATCPSPLPTDESNTSLCYPSWWTPTNGQSFEDWFYKFVVTSVTQSDSYSEDSQPGVTTTYCYGSQSNCLSGGAWHYNDDTLVRSDERTWDQWRGFQDVWTSTGTTPDPLTQSEDIYFRGMNGDYQTGSGGNTSASVTSTVGNVTVTDSDQYSGMDFEHIVYNGSAGPMVTATVTTPWSSQTASQSQPSPLPALTAHLTGTAETQTFTALASGGNRESDTIYGHTAGYGLVTSVASAPDAYDNGVAGPTSEDTCTQSAYAQNTSSNLVDLPSEVVVTSVTPPNCPITYSSSSPPPSSELVSDTRDYYDNSTTLGAAPSKGNLTESTKATSYTGSTENFTTESQDAYDEYGRVTSVTDADGNVTSTAYTPATGAEPTQVQVTSPKTTTAPNGLVTTTTYDPMRELPLTETTAGGQLTTKTYDALGRVTAVWLPTASKAGGADASYTYSYDVTNSAPSAITTNTVVPAGNAYITDVTIDDSMGNPIQTQSETPNGNMDVTSTFYNSDGWKELIFHPFYAVGAPSGSVVSAADDAVPDQTGYVYDGTGRVLKQITYSDATEEYETDTAYGGNYTTTTPPAGGTAQTTYTNGEGLTTYIYQYHSSPPPASPPAPGSGDSAGTAGWDQTAYTYYPSQNLDTITDAAGKQWSYVYSLSGNTTSATDPDTGTTTSTYDNNGNLLSTTTADQQTVSYVYDAEGRKTAEYAATTANQSASNEVAAWVYDTLQKGQLTSSTSYVGGTSGQSYAQDIIGYNSNGLSKGTETKIGGSGPLAGDYVTEDYYAANGTLDEYIDSAAGGLPQETVNIGLDIENNPLSITSSQANYVSALSYTDLDQPLEYNFGPTTNPAYLSEYYNYQGQITESYATAGLSPVVVDNQNYTYNNEGNITSDADTPSGGPAQVQCYTYDYLGRLATAWSQASAGCSAGPSQTAEATATAPYWDAYTYNDENDLTSQVSTPAAGSATTYTNAFPATTGADGPHAIASQQAQGPGGTTTTSYGYDAAGNTTSMTTGSTTTGLNWDGTGQAPGQLAAITRGSTTVASYIYDAGGSLLLQTDGSTTTLYLPDEQIVSTGGTLSGTRYYSLGGVTVAARTSSGTVDYLAGNQQNTYTVAINASTLAVTRRYYDPFGNPIGTPATSWPGTRGFVGGTADEATGLTNLGAREYNPATTTFVTTDPILTPSNPQDLNPYSYAADNPVTKSDPTGLMFMDDGGGGGYYAPVNCSPAPRPASPPASPSVWSLLLDHGPDVGDFGATIAPIAVHQSDLRELSELWRNAEENPPRATPPGVNIIGADDPLPEWSNPLGTHPVYGQQLRGLLNDSVAEESESLVERGPGLQAFGYGMSAAGGALEGLDIADKHGVAAGVVGGSMDAAANVGAGIAGDAIATAAVGTAADLLGATEAGAAIGTALGGPVGTVVGAVLGAAIGGGLAAAAGSFISSLF